MSPVHDRGLWESFENYHGLLRRSKYMFDIVNPGSLGNQETEKLITTTRENSHVLNLLKVFTIRPIPGAWTLIETKYNTSRFFVFTSIAQS